MHRPRKRFGQHFLIDRFIIERLIDSIDPKAQKHYIEIGPGEGALTAELLARGARVSAIEIDRDLVKLLEKKFGSNPNFSLNCADALNVKLATLLDDEKAHIVGNLPYNISTPLLNHLFSQIDHIIEMSFMLQKEVVARMCATPGNKDFGRLSIHTQTHCKTIRVLEVPPDAFSPPPKVDSAVVKLVPHSKQISPHHRIALSELTRLAFAQRRKMIKSSLRTLCSQAELIQHEIDPTSRPDVIPIETYVDLANSLSKRDTQN